MEEDSTTQQTPTPKLHKHFVHKKRFIIWAIVSLVVIAVAGVYFVYFNNIQDSNTQAAEKAAAKRNEISGEVESIVSDKGSQAGQTFLDDELTKTGDSKEQAQLYMSKAALVGSLPGGNDKVKALEYAYKAESLSPDEETALVIALFEESQDNTPNAIKYYKLFLERFSKNSDEVAYSKVDYDYYAARVGELEASIK